MDSKIFVFLLVLITATTAAYAEEEALRGEIGTRLNDAVARYSEHQNHFHAIVDRFRDQPKLLGLGLSHGDERRVETCTDEGGKEVCIVIESEELRSKYLAMGVEQIRRGDEYVLFESAESQTGDTTFYVDYKHSIVQEQESSPCEQLEELRGMDRCTYDLGDGWRVRISWSDLLLEPST